MSVLLNITQDISKIDYPVLYVYVYTELCVRMHIMDSLYSCQPLRCAVLSDCLQHVQGYILPH